jgi:small subunit ribosomal protein S6
MRLYDIVLLVTPDLGDDDAAKIVGDYRKLLADGGAEFVKDEAWGRRRLAYPISKKRDAWYHYFQVQSPPALVAEVGRRLRLSDQILRHMAVRSDEELKRAAKSAERQRVKALKRPPRPPAAAAPEARSPEFPERSET